jgi:AAA domain
MLSAYDPRKNSRNAITDLYDERRSSFLVQYPSWLIIALGTSGILAVALTGFLGYTDLGVDGIFRQPWLLFLWLCMLQVILQVSIFRHRSLRSRLVAVLVLNVVSILIVALIAFGGSLPAVVGRLINLPIAFLYIAANPWTYTILNFGVLAIFWIDSIRRWIRRANGLAPNAQIDLGVYDYAGDLPSLAELVAGDLIAGGFLTLLLALLFEPQVISLVVQTAGGGITNCTLSWPIGVCVPSDAGPNNPPTLSFINVIQTLLYLPAGLLMLALSATISGISAWSGGGEDQASGGSLLLRERISARTQAVSENVSQTVVSTLRSALDRRLRLVVRNFALTLRNVAPPVLILAATYGLAMVALATQRYLHSPKALADAFSFAAPGVVLYFLALVCIVFSSALMLFRWRVVENTLRFLGLIGFVLLLTYWIFALALSGLNLVLLLYVPGSRSPFLPPGFATYVSLAALLFWGIIVVIRRREARIQAREARQRAILQEKRDTGDYNTLLLYDTQDASFMKSQVVDKLGKAFLLPFCGEVGVAELPQVDHVRSAIVCLGEHGAAFTSQPQIVTLLSDLVAQKSRVGLALFPGFKGSVPQSLRAIPQVNLRYPLARVVKRLTPFVDDPDSTKYIANYEWKKAAQQGLSQTSTVTRDEFGRAMLSLMGITNLNLIHADGLVDGEVWTGTLPPTGLKLASKAVFYLRADPAAQARYYEAARDQFGEDVCAMIIDMVDMPNVPDFGPPDLVRIWIRAGDIHSLLAVKNHLELASTAKRLITRNVKEGLYPYKTRGRSNLFFGRETELKQLAATHNYSGIIIGAHQSGKTTLLHKLKENLPRHRRVVLGPMSPTTYSGFFDLVRTSLESLPQGQGETVKQILGSDSELTIDNFERTIRRLREQLGRVSFLIDEIDLLLKADEAQEMRLTRVMRSLTDAEQADFFLAGHSRLRQAITRQGSQLRNFATEIIMTGLDEPSALRLIQDPMEQMGYSVTDEQARRIYRGTAGVAGLIQKFCHDLLGLEGDQIDDTMIETIERKRSFLDEVWNYFDYGLDSISLAILMMAALQPEVDRRQIMERFAAHAIDLSRTILDEHLEFLVSFGVLQVDLDGFYQILALYLRSAIMARDPETLMLDHLTKIGKESG